MARPARRHPDQLPLWWWCGICGGPHYGLVPGEHSSCRAALSRWFRNDNLEVWDDEPNRAVL